MRSTKFWRPFLGGLGTVVGIGFLFAHPAAAGLILFNIPQNLVTGDVDIFLTSQTATSATIMNGSGTFNQTAAVPAGGTAIVTIPGSFRIASPGTVSTNGFKITSDDPIAAYLMDTNRPQASNDITNLFPTESLGKQYRVMAGTSNIVTSGSQLSIVASKDATSVTITPSASLTTGQTAGTPFVVALNELESLELRAQGTGDLTGTLITANEKIGVFGGHLCANVPASTAFCDHIIEQMPSVDNFGTDFVILPTEQAGPGDVLKILAKEDGTVVTIQGTTTTTINLDAGDSVTLDGPGQNINDLRSLTSNKPVLLGQFMIGQQAAGDGDPAFSLVPDVDQWLSEYIFNVPAGDYNDFLGVAIEGSALSSLFLDGVAINPALFSSVPGTSLVAGNISVTDGSHRIRADKDFMLLGHGFNNNFASYFGIGGSSISGGGFEPPPPPPPPNQVPEPASAMLFGVGLLGVGWAVRRRRKEAT